MKKLSKIQESIWGDLHKRGIGELEREEDKIGNIKDMIPVDMGGLSVLWSDRDLEVDDNCYFSFDEANELIEKSGWRLPTREEAEELCVSVRIERNTDKICIVYREDKPDVQLTFKKCGQKYGDNDDKIYRIDTYNTWTSTAQGTEAYRIFKISSLIFGTNFQMHKNNKICVRLVKDKPNDIKESVWGDLHKRGIGELEREEDDINFMDVESFKEYIEHFDDAIIKVYLSHNKDFISVDEIYIETEKKNKYYQLLLVIEYPEKKIFMNDYFKSAAPDVFSKLTKEFSVSVKRGFIYINPKDGSEKTNKFFLDVLRFILDNLKNELNESVWGDLHKRGIGELEREEDDINLLDGHSMLEYIFNHYEIQDNFSQPQYHKDANVLNVPILKVKENRYNTSVNYITYNYNKDCIYIRETLYDEILIKIKKEFNISNFLNGVYTIKNADNSLFIKLIDFIIDNVDPMSKTVFALLYKRKMNESVWGDLHKRGVGELEREEDNIGNLSELKPLDMGLSVLWADKDLEVDGNYLFNFEEANELIEKSEWRLPTLKEVAELGLLYNKEEYFYDDKSFYFENNGNKLIFYRKGFKYISGFKSAMQDQIIGQDYYYCWTSDRYKLDSIHILTFDNDKIYYSPVNNLRVVDQVVQGEAHKLCVRLVKDKEKRED